MRSFYLATVFVAGFAGSTLIADAAVLSPGTVMANLASLGYQVTTIELSGSVYEIQATGPNGFPVELRVDAATGAQVGAPDTPGQNDVADATPDDQPGVDDSSGGSGQDSADDSGGNSGSGGGDSGDSGGGGSGGDGGGDSGGGD